MGLLHENVLDQLPPLIDLKRHLSEILMTAHCSTPNSTAKNLLFEEVPVIRAELMNEVEKAGGFMAIAQNQEEIFLCQDKNKLIEMAKHITSAYDTDLLAELEDRYRDELEEEEANAAATKSAKDTVTTEEKIGDGPDNISVADKNRCANCSDEGAAKKCSICKSNFYCSK